MLDDRPSSSPCCLFAGSFFLRFLHLAHEIRYKCGLNRSATLIGYIYQNVPTTLSVAQKVIHTHWAYKEIRLAYCPPCLRKVFLVKFPGSIAVSLNLLKNRRCNLKMCKAIRGTSNYFLSNPYTIFSQIETGTTVSLLRNAGPSL
jgi:hypothetical protein